MSPASPRTGIAVVSLTILATSLGAQTTFSRVQPIAFDPATAAELKPRYIGPVGNRTVAVAGVPGDPNVYYAGAASGGIWKTTDGGIHWAPIFDGQPVSSIGALAVAPSNPNIVWAGTGEAFIRSHISIGNGVYKSTDAGRTWTRMGLEQTRTHRAHRDRSDESGHRVRRRAGSQLRPAAGARHLSARPTAARPGSACCSSTRTPAASTSSWTRATHACCSPPCGSSRSTRGGARAAGRAAASSSRATAARRGRSSRATGCRRTRSARSGSRSRTRIPTASTR